jgi:hypothetical protein
MEVIKNKMKNIHKINKNIYITYDEIIKEGWHLNTSIGINKPVYVKSEDVKPLKSFYNNKPSHLSKIILTTDQDLIKEGVQAIDDEFLEWFVKNPSCEEVEVKSFKSYSKDNYIMFIPKEEPKMIECYFIPTNNTSSATICGNCGKEKFLHTIGSGIKTSKQQTLEEASWRFNPLKKLDGEFLRTAFIKGAKWQEERMYSEEDLKEAYSMGISDMSIRAFNERFKKK